MIEEYAGHMDDYDRISDDAKEQIVHLYKTVDGATPAQIANLTGIPEHDVVAVLIEKKILPPNSITLNAPDNDEVRVGNEVGSRKKIMGAKNVTKNKQLGTGATIFSYINDSGRPKTHARFNKYQEKICRYWILFMRLGIPYDCIGYRIGLNMNRPYEEYHEEIKDKISHMEADLHLDSADASAVANRKGFAESTEKGKFFCMGMMKFVPVYHQLEEGVINEWEAKEILHLNDNVYQKWKEEYLSKKERNAELYEGYRNRWELYLHDFNDGFKEYFDEYIETNKTINDIVMEINQDRIMEREIPREIFLLKVRLYAKHLHLTKEQKDEIEEVFLASHTVTRRDAYKAMYTDDTTTSDSKESKETTTEETEEETVKEEVSEKMEENIMKEKKKKYRALTEAQIKDAWKRYSETEESVESIALSLDVCPNTLYEKFKKIEKDLPPEKVQEIKKNKRRSGNGYSKAITKEKFSFVENQVKSGEISVLVAANRLGISSESYYNYRKKFAAESSEPADTDNGEMTEAEVISVEVSTEEASGRINSDPPYFADENGVKRWNGNRFKYDLRDEGRPGIDPRVRSEVDQEDGEKLEGAELLNDEGIIEEKIEETAKIFDLSAGTVLLNRKPRHYLLGSDDKTESDLLLGKVTPLSYNSLIKQFAKWIQENIEFDENGTPMEEINIVAYNSTKQVELFAMNEACKRLGVTLEIVFSLEISNTPIPDVFGYNFISNPPEDKRTVVERIIVSNPNDIDMAAAFMFPEDSRVMLEDNLQVNDLYDKEFESVLLRTYSNDKITYSWRIISDGNGLDIYKKILVDYVTDLSKLLTVELRSSKIDKNGVVVDNDTKAIFSTYGANNGKEE